jgi:hypothetical protein
MLVTVSMDIKWSDDILANLFALITRGEEWVSHVVKHGEVNPEYRQMQAMVATTLIGYICLVADVLEENGVEGLVETLPDWQPFFVRIQALV